MNSFREKGRKKLFFCSYKSANAFPLISVILTNDRRKPQQQQQNENQYTLKESKFHLS